MDLPRLEKQLRFIVEADKLKSILRRSTLICDNQKRENDAEHSWHLALCAVVLLEYAEEKEKIDLLHVLKILIIHDMVEIEAGDTYCYDELACLDQSRREQDAANHLFSMLPQEQGREFMGLWEEFEEMATPEARYAAAIDRLQPLLQIYGSKGNTWIENGIDIGRELERNRMMEDAVPKIWEYAKDIIEDAAQKGWLKS